MKIDSASDAPLIELFVSGLALTAIFVLRRWLSEREISRSLGNSHPKLVGVEGPMTKAEAQIAAAEDRAPIAQLAKHTEEPSFAEESKTVKA
jgi:hypothetical protein